MPVITIQLAGIFPAVAVEANIAGTGAAFTASTKTTVAQRPGTEVRFDGTVTPTDGVVGTLTVGANGTLPTGQSIVFDVDLDKVG